MINTVVVIFATKIMNLFGNGCVHNVKKLIFLQKSLEFSIIKFIFAASFIRFQFSSSNIKYIDNQLVTVIKIQMICKCKYKTI